MLQVTWKNPVSLFLKNIFSSSKEYLGNLEENASCHRHGMSPKKQ
jgi:hypothetical protein